MELLNVHTPKTKILCHSITGVEHMYKLGVRLPQDTILYLLQRCIKERDILGGKRVHRLMVALRLDIVAILVEHLIRLFALSSYIFDANLIFAKVSEPSVFTWHALILSSIEHQNSNRALELYIEMLQDGCEPNKFIYMGVLKACGNLGSLHAGRLTNIDVIRSNLEMDVVVGNTLIDMYTKSGSVTDARKVFDDLPCRDILSWGALLGGYAQSGQSLHAIELLEGMLFEGIRPNNVILACVLKACRGSQASLHGRLVHHEVLELDLKSDPVISSALIDMYAKSGCLSEACKVHEMSSGKCAVSWCALIGGLAQQGQQTAAFNMFERMQQDGTKPNEFIFASLASSCSKLEDLERGKLLHDRIIKSGLEADVVLGNTLTSMYADCKCLSMAQNVFNKLTNRSMVSWSTMISGYTQNGCALLALKLFERMQQEGTAANVVVYSAILKACSDLGALELGKLIHHLLLKSEENLDVVVGSTLIDLYISCHRLEEACNVFDHLPERNAVCWGMMIAGIAQCGIFSLVGEYLDKMLQQGLKSNAKMFTSILVACNQKGKVEEGQHYFKLMTELHEIIPSGEHIHCMVDLLGRTGHLIEAEKLLEGIHTVDDLSGWVSLLSACRMHRNVWIGRRSFDYIISRDCHEGSVYSLMSSIYAEANMWDEYQQLLEQWKRKLPKSSGLDTPLLVEEVQSR